MIFQAVDLDGTILGSRDLFGSRWTVDADDYFINSDKIEVTIVREGTLTIGRCMSSDGKILRAYCPMNVSVGGYDVEKGSTVVFGPGKLKLRLESPSMEHLERAS